MNEVDELIDYALKTNVFGKGFKFRKSQREIITVIVNQYLSNPESSIIIDAPTGTGKSLIAMWCSWLIKELGGCGYLLTSDLSLQDQYETDFTKFKLGWPSIRGIDNYECHINNMKFSLGECRLRNMGYSAALALLDCAKTCDYIQARQKAISHNITLLNYSYWLIQRNYVAKKSLEDGIPVPFKKRNFVFFDEAHQIDRIVQTHFSPRIHKHLTNIVPEIIDFLDKENISYSKLSSSAFSDLIYDLFKIENKKTYLNQLVKIRKILAILISIKNQVTLKSEKKFGKTVSEPLPGKWRMTFNRLDLIKDVYCKIDDYLDIIKENGVDSMVIDKGEEEIKFMCVNESKMIQKYLHNQAGFKVFMSATIGNPNDFMKIMGITDAKIIRLNSIFNFEKSPIVFINRHKLSYSEKERNLPKVIEIMDQIISKHKNHRGIIHTGSYSFSNYIKSNSKHLFRLIDYEDSKEKSQMLELFKKKKNSILMGPSLLEGLDLKDDISRFQIFFKVPYPSLGDPLIKAKLNHIPNWYDWKTSNNLLQGVGRSVRSDGDWAITYILDACFNSLLTKPNNFGPSFKERIKIIN